MIPAFFISVNCLILNPNPNPVMRIFFNFFRECSALLFFFSFISCGFSQSGVEVGNIVAEYEQYKERSLTKRRTTRKDILPLINELKGLDKFTVQKVGESIEGRDLTLISIGTGDTSVFLWSQMHGDESTATMALFDIFNFLNSEDYKDEKQQLLENVTLHFLPMLNPDGAEMFARRNALGIDVNRDALRLQSPEGQTLKRIRDSLDADWGFNLHDQSKYYNVQGTDKPATISFLAPAFDYEKNVDEKRADAMQLIVVMSEQLQKYIPGQVARYNDDFEPRAFGDNIQKWGTRTILIESGGNYDDPEKQEIRKMNFAAILSALFAISNSSYEEVDHRKYNEIPHNDSNLFDLKLTGLVYNLNGEEYILDLGINHQEIFARNPQGFYYSGRIADQGDLSTSFGYEAVDVSGYKLKPGKVYEQLMPDLAAVGKLDFDDLLKKGYTYVRVKNLPRNQSYSKYPVQLVGESFKVPTRLQPGIIPSFLLENEGQLEYVVVNGFLYKLDGNLGNIRNGGILK